MRAPPIMPYRSFLAGASGATLGYIVNNAPGAIKGWHLGRSLARKMPARRSLSRGRSLSRRPAKRARLSSRTSRTRSRGRSVNSTRSSRTAQSYSRGRNGGPGRQSDAGQSGCVVKSRGRRQLLPKGMKRILAPQVLNSTNSGTMLTIANRQFVTLLRAYVGSQNLSSPYLMAYQDNLDMQYSLSASEFVPTGTAATNNYLTRKYMVKSIRAKYTMKNQTTTPIEVTLYDVVARRDSTVDTNRGPDSLWSFGVSDEAVNLPGPGGGPAIANPSNAQTSSFPGAKPWQSQYFNQYWKVKKTTKFVLHPGSNHIHYITVAPKYPMNYELMKDLAIVRGLTTTLMAVIKGGVAQDSTVTGAVGSSAAELAYTTEIQYQFFAMEKSRTAYTQYNGFTGNASRTILEDTDAVTTVTQV